jgi:glutathione S-transferase
MRDRDHRLSPDYRNSPEWRAISPAGKVPALTDGELTMFESGAMVDYLLERYGDGRLRPPPGTHESALHHQWCWFAEATLSRPLGLNRILRGDTGSPLAAEGERKARDSLAVVDQAVADRDFLLGDEFGAADIMMGYTLQLISSNGLLDDKYPHAGNYLARLKRRDAFQLAMNT